MTHYVLGFVFSPDEREIVLLRKNRPEWQAGKLNGVGGHVEEDELIDNAMVREGREELGVELPWTGFASLTGRDFTVWCYRTEVSYAIIDALPWENDVGEEIQVLGLHDLEDAIPNLSWMIPMARKMNQKDWPYRIKQER